MAVKLWIPGATGTMNGSGVDVSPLGRSSKWTTGDIDETDRVTVGASGRSEFDLRVVSGAVSTPIGDVTGIKMHFRIYYSNNGPVALDDSSFLGYVAPYFVLDGSTYWNCPDVDFPGGVQSFMGYYFSSFTHNFNLPGEPVAKVCEWDIGALGLTWDATKLSSLTFGLAMKGDYLGPNPFRYSGWAPDPGGGGNTPRYNFTQLVLEVDADDPPAPPPTSRGLVLVTN